MRYLQKTRPPRKTWARAVFFIPNPPDHPAPLRPSAHAVTDPLKALLIKRPKGFALSPPSRYSGRLKGAAATPKLQPRGRQCCIAATGVASATASRTRHSRSASRGESATRCFPTALALQSRPRGRDSERNSARAGASPRLKSNKTSHKFPNLHCLCGMIYLWLWQHG